MSAALRSLRIVWRTLSIAARLAVAAALVAAWLMSAVLTATLPAVFALASSVAGLVVSGADTIRGRHVAEVGAVERRLARTEAEAAGLARRNGALARRLADADAERIVTYRGARRAAREAVGDASRRIATRATAASARNIATMPGESIPFWGIAIVVGATAWEVADTCTMMGDLHALDVAFNPDHAISDREVCGMRVPTAAEIWERVKSAPKQIWADMRGLIEGLPAEGAAP
jgi:hypothetical protein